MIPQRRKYLINALILFDLLIFVLCFLLATALVDLPADKISLRPFLAMRVKVGNMALFAGFLALWSLVLHRCKLYDSRRLSRLGRDVRDVFTGTSIGTLIVFSLGQLFHVRMISGPFIVVFWVSVFCATTAVRILLKLGLGRLRSRGMNMRDIVIVGSGTRAVTFAHSLVSKAELGYRLLGFVDSGSRRQQLERAGYRLVADFRSFAEYLRQHVVDEVMICLPIKSCYRKAARIAALCEEHGIVVRVISDLFEGHARTETDDFEGRPLITRYVGHMTGPGMIVKRVVDVVVSGVLILVLSPLLLVVALLIKLSDPGPVFFVQQRLGLNKRYFGVYKFRTMFQDAEKRMAEVEHLNEVSGPVFKISNDPRITPLGKSLRRTSIDELPQLFNVFKGDMSLVGPRPLPIRDYQGFDQDWHRRRFSVLPGITCTWQISGRSGISFERWMELDMQYIDNWSLWLDLKILVKTVPAVLRGSGAV